MNIKKIILAFAASAMLARWMTSLDMDPVSDITDLNYWKLRNSLIICFWTA